MMKLISRLLIAAALLATGSLALASPDHDDHGRHDRDSHGHSRGHDDHRRHGNEQRRYGYHDRGPRYYGRPHWQRGHRYNGPTYVVSNYGHYRLRQPPRGYHWVRANNNDFLLVAVATGIILDVALH